MPASTRMCSFALSWCFFSCAIRRVYKILRNQKIYSESNEISGIFLFMFSTHLGSANIKSFFLVIRCANIHNANKISRALRLYQTELAPCSQDYVMHFWCESKNYTLTKIMPSIFLLYEQHFFHSFYSE